MTRNILFKRTIDNIEKLSDQKLQEVSDFTEFLLNKTENDEINQGMLKLAAESSSFKFLQDDEDLYTLNDLKVIYK